MASTLVTARPVSQVRVEDTRVSTVNRPRFSHTEAPGTNETPVPAPTAYGQNHRFISAPNR